MPVGQHHAVTVKRRQPHTRVERHVLKDLPHTAQVQNAIAAASNINEHTRTQTQRKRGEGERTKRWDLYVDERRLSTRTRAQRQDQRNPFSLIGRNGGRETSDWMHSAGIKGNFRACRIVLLAVSGRDTPAGQPRNAGRPAAERRPPSKRASTGRY